jgi:hypothetical protein
MICIYKTYYISLPLDQKIVIMKIRYVGIGNQLFRYAAARNLANRLNAKLWIVKREATQDKSSNNRDFCLDQFNTKYDQLISPKQFIFIKTFYKTLRVDEGNFHNIHNVNGNILLIDNNRTNGVDLSNFESEQFFLPIKDEISNLKFKNPYQNDLLTTIIKSESVAVHIRRGDFADYNRIIPLTYQIKAMEKMLSLHSNVHFFIFSDDIDFIKSAFSNLKNVTIASQKGINSINELYLMSRCKHIIIANSTFSWWAAYLNKNPNKIVIAPNIYANKEYLSNEIKAKHYEEDFYLADWIKLPEFGIREICCNS